MKDDFLRECMSEVNARLRERNAGPIPLNEFNLINCRLCARRECARSGLNNSAFDKRVHNWREKLFTNVPRAEEEDSQWDHLRAKKFISGSVPSVEVKSFRSPPVEKPEPTPEPVQSEAKEPEPTPEPTPEPEPPPELDIPKQQTPPPAVESPSNPIENTPFTQGTVLSEEGGDTVLEPGGTYTFGDD
jgi:hypothetical protein